MKNIRLSFAVLVAIAALGFTVATKANFSGKTIIANCFKTVTVTDAAQFSPTSIALDGQDCPSAVSTIGSSPYLELLPVIEPSIACQEVEDDFCCATFVEVTDPNAPNYSRIPLIDLDGAGGEPAKKWAVQQVYCKDRQ